MQEHYRLANGVSKDEANLVFHNAARKVIKDTFKHTRCIYVASYYMQVNLLPFYM
jgi:magnesium-transporting ATPase (P-type)